MTVVPFRNPLDQPMLEVLQRVLDHLDVTSHNDVEYQYSAHCPAHDDQHASLSVSIGAAGDRVLLYCHAGCELEEVLAAAHLAWADLFRSGNLGRIVAEYDYVEPDGRFIYQNVRFEPKAFRPRRRPLPEDDPQTIKHGWVWRRRPLPYRLYNLPQLAHGDRTLPLIISASEKDVQHVQEHLGFPATCNFGGEGKWLRVVEADRALVADWHVVIVPHNDAAGRRHAYTVYEDCSEHAASIRWLELPGLVEHGDISDWLEAGGTRDQLLALIAQAPETPPPDVQLERVIVPETPLREIVARTQYALERRQMRLPALDRCYSLNGVMTRVRIQPDDRFGRLSLEPVGLGTLQLEMSHALDFLEPRGQGFAHVNPPFAAVRALREVRTWGLQALRGVSAVPIIREDGSLFTDPNRYDAATGLLYSPPPGFTLPAIPLFPTPDDVASAVATLREPFAEFPFADAASRDHTFALVLTPLLRAVLNDVAPLFAITAPEMGTGKSLLTDAALSIALGDVPGGTSNPDETELRKEAVTKLHEGRPIVLYDNVEGGFASPFLESALTRRILDVRLLGEHKGLQVLNDATWVINGNNLRLLKGLARRHCLIRINADVESPATRTVFTHWPLLPWITAERPRLLAAAFTLIRAWFAAGQPSVPPERVLASFERWSSVIGGICWQVGATHFLANRDEAQEQSDPNRGDWTVWRRCLYEAVGAQPFRANAVYDKYLTQEAPQPPEHHTLDLTARAETVEQRIRLGQTTPVYDYLPEELQSYTNVRGRFTRRLGQALRDQVNTIRGGLRLELVGADGARGHEYRLVAVSRDDGGS